MIQLFSNNALDAVKNAGGITAIGTSIEVVDSSIFALPTVADDTYELLTLKDGDNIEIVKVTNNDTGTNTLTVVREQEGTTGYAFPLDSAISGKVTAGTLSRAFLERADPSTLTDPIGLNAVDLVPYRDNATAGAVADYSVAIGSGASVRGDQSVAIGDGSDSFGDRALSIGQGASCSGNDGVAVGSVAITLGTNTVSVGVWAGDDDSTSSYNVMVGYAASSNTTGADYTTTLGANADCFNSYSTALGALVQARSDYSLGAGYNADVTGNNSIGLGADSIVSAADTIGIGYTALARITKTHVINGASIIRKDVAETDELLYFVGQENILFSQEYDFKTTAAADVITIEIPTGSTFFVSEVGIIPTVASGITLQPTIEFGSNTTTDAILTATGVTTATVKKRERYQPDATNWVADADNVGHTVNLTVSVTVAATGTSFSGRVYFKGMLLEDE